MIVDIHPSFEIAIHKIHAGKIYYKSAIVIGEKPIGPRGGKTGMWMSGREIFCGCFKTMRFGKVLNILKAGLAQAKNENKTIQITIYPMDL